MSLVLLLLIVGDDGDRKLPLLLNQVSYSDVNDSRRHRSETIDIIRAAHSWGFDGIELSMDALINEFGSNGRQFHQQVQQLADEIVDSKLVDFHLRLDVDFESKLSSELDMAFKDAAVTNVVKLLKIKSYWSERAYPFNVDNVAPLVIHINNDTYYPSKKELAVAKYVSLKLTPSARFGISEDGKFYMCSHKLQTAYKRIDAMLKGIP